MIQLSTDCSVDQMDSIFSSQSLVICELWPILPARSQEKGKHQRHVPQCTYNVIVLVNNVFEDFECLCLLRSCSIVDFAVVMLM